MEASERQKLFNEDTWWLLRGRIDKMPKGSGVYLLRHRTSGKLYVGASAHMYARCCKHYLLLSQGLNTTRIRAEFGTCPRELEFVPLLLCAPEDLEMYEQRAIDVLNPALNGRRQSLYWL